MSQATALQAGLMLQAPWSWRRNNGSLWALRLWTALTLLLVGAPALSALLWAPPRQAWLVIGVLGLAVVVGLYIMQFAALLRLDHPHAAHAVPGHRSAVRLAALLPWAAGVLLYGLAAAVVSALVFAADARAVMAMGLAAGLAAATVMLLVAAAYRWWWMWVVMSMLPTSMAIPGWSGLVVRAFSWASGVWQAQSLGLTALLLLAQGLALVSLFGQGDAAHADAYARRERLRQTLAANSVGQATPMAALGRWGEWLGRPLQRLSDAWLSRVCAAARPTAASVMARAEVVLYTNQHWVRHLAVVVFVQGLLLACMALVVAWVDVPLAQMLKHGHMGISIGLMSLCVSPVLGVHTALWHSRREQALLLLLPGMPQGRVLNHLLARRQAQHCLLLWASSLPGFVLVGWLGGTPEVMAFPLVELPLLAWLWRDTSRLQQPQAISAWPYGLCVLLGVLAMALLRWQPAAWWPLVLAVPGLTAVLLRWRWQRLASLPQALPAGRLG
ncbi:MAG: hypothetical protein IPF94_00835 [Betaproteobacteria bacterium]|nr:hypothetical protein [Betaproteobacteria bacterium]